jgi:phosphopantetheine adenylyltransferase
VHFFAKDDALLRNKANKHVLESFDVRAEQVRKFLQFFKPSVVPDITPIIDVYGPTGWDPNIQALVVSKETIGGAEASTSRLPCPTPWQEI